MPEIISSFRDEYAFLSNFYPCAVQYESIWYPSAEHAFQAAKTLDVNLRHEIAGARSPSKAKHLGQTLKLRKDWERYKIDIMLKIIQAKFQSFTSLGNQLVATAPAMLVEGNLHHDNYWGDCMCPRCESTSGRNMLGQLLALHREDLIHG